MFRVGNRKVVYTCSVPKLGKVTFCTWTRHLQSTKQFYRLIKYCMTYQTPFSVVDRRSMLMWLTDAKHIASGHIQRKKKLTSKWCFLIAMGIKKHHLSETATIQIHVSDKNAISLGVRLPRQIKKSDTRQPQILTLTGLLI